MDDLDRRCKILYLPVRDIVAMLGGWQGRDVVSLCNLNCVPEGYTVKAATYDFERQSIAILIQHPSFEPQDLGAQYPAINHVAGYYTMIDLRQMTPAEKELADPMREVPAGKRPKRAWEFLGAPR